MDIIITGEQGAGKTTQAEAITENLKHVSHVFDYDNPPEYALLSFYEHEPDGIVFDDIPNMEILHEAIRIVQEYRRVSNTDVTAVYCMQGVITDILKPEEHEQANTH